MTQVLHPRAVKRHRQAEKSAQEKLHYQDVLKYLTERSYRAEAEKQWKRTIRRKAKDFTVNDGQFYLKGKNGQEVRRWVFDKEDQKRLATMTNEVIGHPAHASRYSHLSHVF